MDGYMSLGADGKETNQTKRRLLRTFHVNLYLPGIRILNVSIAEKVLKLDKVEIFLLVVNV